MTRKVECLLEFDCVFWQWSFWRSFSLKRKPLLHVIHIHVQSNLIHLAMSVQWNLAIKSSDITKPSYNKVIILVPALLYRIFCPFLPWYNKVIFMFPRSLLQWRSTVPAPIRLQDFRNSKFTPSSILKFSRVITRDNDFPFVHVIATYSYDNQCVQLRESWASFEWDLFRWKNWKWKKQNKKKNI